MLTVVERFAAKHRSSSYVTGNRKNATFTPQKATDRKVSSGPPLVPEGHRRKLAGGKSAPADAAPGSSTEKLSLPQRGIEETAPTLTAHRISPRSAHRPLARNRECTAHPKSLGKILRCPAGARPTSHVHRGLRPLARTCPRLNSCGVPPGPGTTRLAQFIRLPSPSLRLFAFFAAIPPERFRRTSRPPLAA